VFKNLLALFLGNYGVLINCLRVKVVKKIFSLNFRGLAPGPKEGWGLNAP